MFNLLTKEIKFEHIEAFCREYAENVRVEYKQGLPSDIPKTVSAFANTAGGIWVIGVVADPVTNKPVALDGIPKNEAVGISEKIINASLNGIYPSLVPDVGVISVPGTGNIIAVVKIEESIQAPHAIEGTTKVYIRTGNQAHPYQLAELSRIEFFLKRRAASEARRVELVKRAHERGLHYYGPSLHPWITVSVGPPYPYQPVISKENLWEFARSPSVQQDERAAAYLGHGRIRRVTDGVAYGFREGPERSRYIELSEFGLLFFWHGLRLVIPSSLERNPEVNTKIAVDPTPYRYLVFGDIVRYVGRVLYLAQKFYGHCGYTGNLQADVKVANASSRRLLIRDVDVDIEDEGFRAIEDEVYASDSFIAYELGAFPEKVENLMKELCWAFNCQDSGLKSIVADYLSKDGLI